MGSPVDRKYDALVHNYFEKKVKKRAMADFEEDEKHQHAMQAVQMNRKLYEKINKKSKYGSILNPSQNNEQEIFSTIRK